MSDRQRFLILFRHGIAQEKGTKPDEQRSLTATGHQRMKEIAAGFAAFAGKPDAIYTSPLVRCVQTAEWLARAWKRRVRFEETDALRPEAGTTELRRLLEAAGDAQRILCVGHEPNLSTLMLDLTGTHLAGELELKKGGCYGLHLPVEGPARLEWMLPPRVMRRTR